MNDAVYLRASAYLDDELPPDERELAERDPETMELVAELAMLQARMNDVRPDHTDRDDRILAAIQAAHTQDPPQPLSLVPPVAGPESTQAPVSSTPPPPSPHSASPSSAQTHGTTDAQRASRMDSMRWLGIAAGVIALGLFAVVLVGAFGSSSDDTSMADNASESMAADATTDLDMQATGAATAPVESEEAEYSDTTDAMATESYADESVAAMSTDAESAMADDGGAMADAEEYDVGGDAAESSAATTVAADGSALPPPSEVQEMIRLWGMPPELTGEEDLKRFTADAMRLVPPAFWPSVELPCEPIGPDGQELTPLTKVMFQRSPGAPEMDAVVALRLDPNAADQTFETHIIDPIDCSIVESGSTTVPPPSSTLG